MPTPLTPVGEITLRKKTQHRKVQEMFAEALVVRNTISNIENNGSGLIRITTSGAHGLSTNDRVIIDNVSGTVEANGYWTVTNVSSTQFTLNSSTFTNTWTGGGNVCDGQSYSIQMAANGGSGILVSVDLKDVQNGVVDGSKSIKQITGTGDEEVFRSISGKLRAVSAMTITNNSGATRTGNVRIRTTKKDASVVQSFCPFSLINGYTLVIGGDGVRSMYTDTGLPYTSAGI